MMEGDFVFPCFLESSKDFFSTSMSRGRPVGRPCSRRGYSQYSPVWAYSLRIYDAIVWQCVLAQIALRLVLSAQAALPPLVQHGFGAGRGRVVVLASASDLIFILGWEAH